MRLQLKLHVTQKYIVVDFVKLLLVKKEFVAQEADFCYLANITL